MQFTAPVSIDETVSILSSHAQTIPILPDTVVEVSKDGQANGEFFVKRCRKAKPGQGNDALFEVRGTLNAASDRTTTVNASIHVDMKAYVGIAVAVILVLIGVNNRNGAGFAIVGFVFAVLFAFDLYVLYRIIDSLKTGRRR